MTLFLISTLKEMPLFRNIRYDGQDIDILGLRKVDFLGSQKYHYSILKVKFDGKTLCLMSSS